MTCNITRPSATIAGQIIEIFEENKLTIAQSKKILSDVENALNSQVVNFKTQNVELTAFDTPQTIGICPKTIGIINDTTK